MAGISHYCLNNNPPELAPDDYDNTGGGAGLGGDGPSMCAHPFIEGEFIVCGSCDIPGYSKDANGNCVKVEDIVNDLNDPCLKLVANKLINKNLTNEINTAISEIFNDNNFSTNLVLQESTLRNKLAFTSPAFVDAYGNFHITINFNPNYMYNASREYIAAVLYHEAMHAYLTYNQNGSNQLQQHYLVAQEYLSWISSALREAYANLSIQDAKGLSVRFLADVNIDNPAYFEQLVEDLGFSSLQELIEATDEYRDGIKGTNCN